MKFQYLAALIAFFPVLIIQTTFIPFISLQGVVPDLVVILLLLFTLSNDQMFGTILGFIYGFLFDLITGSLLGSAMIAKTLAGFVGGYFATETKKENYLKSYSFSLIIFLCALIDSTVFSFFSAVDITSNIFLIFFEQALLPALYTAVVSVLVVIFYPKRKMF